MRSPWRNGVLACGTLSVLHLLPIPALANGFFTRNVYVAPTTYVEALPTAYVLPTTYVYAPTSYVLSSSYAFVQPTVSIVPTTYRYVRRPVYAPTTYVWPSSYYVPTVVEVPTVSYVADSCCSTSAPAVRSGPVEKGADGLSPASKTKPAMPSREESAVAPTPKSLESEPASSPAEESMTRRETAPPPAPANLPKSSSSAVGLDTPSPPDAPVPEKEPVTPITPPEKAVTPPAAVVPVAPGGDAPIELPPPGGADEAIKRQAAKAVYSNLTKPSARKGNLLNVLQGKVVSGDTGQTEEGVRLTIANRVGNFADRPVVTDAFGRFAVRLPDGDWSVTVTMPSGRSYVVSQLVVSGGKISDDLGRDIPSLTITR